MNAVVQFKERATWRAWGLNHLREQGSAFLVWGPSGTGKTVIAEYISLQVVKKGLREVGFGDFGSRTPGENARQIQRIFKEAHEKKDQTLFFDEVDAILMDRAKLGTDMKWMTEIISELMIQIGKYHGLVILATNHPDNIDPAIERRIIAKVHVPVPERRERALLWKQKWPKMYPLALTPDMVDKLSDIVVTGAEVENTIIEVSSDAIREKRKPTLEDFCNVATRRAFK